VVLRAVELDDEPVVAPDGVALEALHLGVHLRSGGDPLERPLQLGALDGAGEEGGQACGPAVVREAGDDVAEVDVGLGSGLAGGAVELRGADLRRELEEAHRRRDHRDAAVGPAVLVVEVVAVGRDARAGAGAASDRHVDDGARVVPEAPERRGAAVAVHQASRHMGGVPTLDTPRWRRWRWPDMSRRSISRAVTPAPSSAALVTIPHLAIRAIRSSGRR
jgi:hypothetical protein